MSPSGTSDPRLGILDPKNLLRSKIAFDLARSNLTWKNKNLT